MEEDEDVILEGTSLHEHLKELGFTDYEVVSSCNKRNALMKEMCPVIPKHEMKMRVLRETYSYVRNGISLITGWNDLEKSLLSLMSLRVTEAKILEEEDLMILETLSPAMQKLSLILLQDKEFDDAQFKLSSWKFILEIFQKPYLWFALTSVLVIHHFVFDLFSLYGLMLFIVILGAVMFIRIAALWIYKRNLCKFYEFQSVILKANQICLKCLRFINEVNILKKGIGPNYAELNLLECCYEKSLYEALHLLLNSLTSLLQSTCSEMRQMNIEHAGVHSLFHRRYGVRGPQECTVRDENTFHVLKDKRNGVSLLSSAFLTEFLLCFEMCGSFSLFELISSSNLTSVKKEIESLEKILNLSKKIWLEEEPNLKVVLNKSKSYERLKVDVSGAVDTLSVKCRILAYSCVQLQELVTTVESYRADLSLDDIQQSCEDIKNKILSCNASLEEVVERTDNLLAQKVGDMHRNLYINTGTENIEENGTINFAKTFAPTENLKKIQPPVIEDEVFEAVADHQLHSLEGDKMLFETLKKEKQIKKKQKERCRRVLQEIQPILQKRRKLWEERETKAINRMKQKQANENSPSETSTSEIFPSGISPSGDSGINSPVINFIPDAGSKENILHSASESVTSDEKMNFSIPRKDFCSSHDYDVEYDSEEERLELYRRVRKELDEDEARRKMEDQDCDTDSEEEAFYPQRRARKDLNNDKAKGKNKDDLNKCDSDSEYEEISSVNLSQRKSLFTLPLKTLEDSSVEGRLFQNFENKSVTKNRNFIHDDLDKNNLIRLRDNDAILKIKQNSVSSSLQNSMTLLSVDTEDTISKISCGSQETDSNLHLIHDGENSYSCGDSSDENERVLDWSSCGFRARRPEEDEVIKVMPFSGVSTMLTLALTRPPPQGGEEEVFGGVGEGESDSEDSVTSDEPVDLA